MLAEKLKEIGALKFGDFILSSGKRSSYYIDIKIACTHPEILNLIRDLMIKLIEDEKITFDKIACVELGGVPLAVALSMTCKKPYVIFRKQKKDYGIGDDLVGDIKNGERIVVVEDVTTTGNSALSVVTRAEKAGGNVTAIIAVVDRNEGAKELFTKHNLKFIPLLEVKELIKGDYNGEDIRDL
jgi:orotate phosphoribosyltransferase